MTRERYRITHGDLGVTMSRRIRRDGSAFWRFGWKEADGKWRYISHKHRDALIERAKRMLAEAAAGFSFSALPPQDRDFLARVHRACPRSRRASLIAELEGK